MTDHPWSLPIKPRIVRDAVEKLLGLPPLAKIYLDRPPDLDPVSFLQYGLDALGVTVRVNHEENLAEIPATGPLLIVANHPLGGPEGLALARVIGRIRPDIQVLTNRLLCLIPSLAPIFIGVDILSGKGSTANVSGLKRVHRHLQSGGAVLIFPAGQVSAFDFSRRRIQDRTWTRLVGQLAKRYECTCLPVHVGGRNNWYFYCAGIIHPRLRTLLLPRQFINKRGSELSLTIGRPIMGTELRLLRNPRAVTDYLRVSTDALDRQGTGRKPVPREGVADLHTVGMAGEISRSIADLEEFCLIEHEEMDVYCAPFDRLGAIMEQIAIAREITFRSVGEGTGMAQDSDRFDPHYLHLFLWDKHRQRVAGAYRVGLVDEIVANHGVHGLYTRSLYRYDETFIRKLGAAIEMGRSFIHPDYQRKPLSLTLLWRGIGAILVRRPTYHTLFGSVSISREYSDLARALIADTLLTNFKASEFEPLVKPLTPHRVDHRVWTAEMLQELSNVKMLGKLIGRCDPGKAVPVLLRHYLSLNGRLVCFNIHSNFNDSLEGLIIVDVRKTDQKTLIRFLGAEGYQHFISFHQLQDSA